MSNNKITEAIQKAAKESNIDLTINPSTYGTTLKSLNIDSLGAMSIIVNAEKELGVHLNDEDLITLKTLGDLVKAFEKVI